MAKVPELPTSVPGCELLPYMSARRRNQLVDVVFESVGGTERLTDWAEKNYGDFVTKVWIKGLPSNSATEHTVSPESIEALWDKLDAEDRAKTIEGHAVLVEAPVDPSDDNE